MRRTVELGIGVALTIAAVRGAAIAAQSAQTSEPSRRVTSATPLPADAIAPRASVGAAPIGASFDVDAAMRAHADPIASYTLHATLDVVKHDLHGEGTITWKNASSIPQKELWLHLYLNAFKNDRTVFQRFPVGDFRGGGGVSDWGHVEITKLTSSGMGDLWASAEKTSPGEPDDETDVRVPLPRAVDPNESIELDVAWDEHLPDVEFRTGYAGGFHLVGQWFPKLARLEPDGRWAHFTFHHLAEFYADFGRYDVTIDTPKGVVVGATGKLDSERASGDRVERRFVQDDVHDFAFTAWDRFRALDATHDGVAIRCLYPPGYDEAAKIEIDAAIQGLEHFGKAFGRYPYSTLTLVHPPESAPEAGGMEYPTFITTGGSWAWPWSGVRAIDVVTLHELGHQWFYGLVATNEREHPFLDEGVNSYVEADVMRARAGDASIGRVLGGTFALEAYNRASAAIAERDAAVATPAYEFATGGDYGALVYQRTATILATLARVYGEELVRKAIGRYARRYRFEHPGPRELLGAIEEVVGAEAAEQARAALFDEATVDYAVEAFGSEPAYGARGIFGDPKTPREAPRGDDSVYRGTILVRRRGALRFPVEIELRTDDGAKRRIVWDARVPSARLPFEGTSRLVGVVIDPDHKVLLDDDLTNNARVATPASVAPQAFERAIFAAEAAITLASP